LIFEIFFNNKLIDTVSGVPTRNDIDALELWGRGLSSFGLAMFFWSIKKPNIFKPGTFLLFVAISGSMFLGQKTIVENFVESRTGAERHASLISLLAKQSMISNPKLIEEHFNADDEHEKKAILAMSGMFGFFSNQVEYIMGEPETNIRSYSSRMYEDNKDEFYKAYKNISNISKEMWKGYSESNNELQSMKDDAGDTANKLWVESGAHKKLDKLFSKYKSKRKQANQINKNYPGNIGRLFKDNLFSRVVNCKDSRCAEKASEAISNLQRKKYMGERIGFNELCSKKSKTSNPVITVKTDDVWQSRTETSKYGKGVKYITDHNLYCDFSRNAMVKNSTVKRLLKKRIDLTMGDDFKGISLEIETYDRFVRDKAILEIIKRRLRSKGVTEFDRNFDISTQERAINSIKRSIIRTADKGGNTVASSIPAGLSYDQFMKNRSAQKLLDDKLCGVWKRGLKTNLSQTEYEKVMSRDNVTCTQNDMRRHLKNGKRELAPGGSHESSGVFYAKLALIPSFAAILSLIAIVLNSLSLVFSLTKHYLRDRIPKTRIISSIFLVLVVIAAPLVMVGHYSNTFESGKIFLGMQYSPSVYIPVLYYLAFEPLLLKYTTFLYGLSVLCFILIIYIAQRNTNRKFNQDLRKGLGGFNIPKIPSSKKHLFNKYFPVIKPRKISSWGYLLVFILSVPLFFGIISIYADHLRSVLDLSNYMGKETILSILYLFGLIISYLLVAYMPPPKFNVVLASRVGKYLSGLKNILLYSLIIITAFVAGVYLKG